MLGVGFAPLWGLSAGLCGPFVPESIDSTPFTAFALLLPLPQIPEVCSVREAGTFLCPITIFLCPDSL